MDPEELGLPWPSWQDGQWDVICDVVAQDTKYIILEAPTGVGKSAIALATGAMLGGNMIVLTGTKQLQDQYAAIGPRVLKAIGRNNFACHINPAVTADEADCTLGFPCELKRGNTDLERPRCDYFGQRWDAENAPIAVLNYPYWLAQANYTRKFTMPGLLVCDEAHTLESEVRNFATATFRRSTFDRVHLTWPRGTDVDTWRAVAGTIQMELTGKARTYQRSGDTSLSEPERKYRRAVIQLYQAAGTLLNPSLIDDGWVIQDQGWGVLAKPVWGAPLMPQYVLKHATKILFMSATFLGKEQACFELGLNPNDVTYLPVPSRFPKVNRPLYYKPVGKVTAGRTHILDRLVGAIDRLLDEHPNESGLIHTVSYKIAQHIMLKSRHATRLMSHDSKTRVETLERFKATPGAVLVSPSMGTGVDLPYDLCRFQIIAKLPFPDKGDPQIAKRLKEGPDGELTPESKRWYSWVTACALVQAYGRGMRAVDDSCVTYLLDGTWGWFRHAVRDMLPRWFSEALISRPWPDDVDLAA